MIFQDKCKGVARVWWWDKCMLGMARFNVIFKDGSHLTWHECDNQVRCAIC